MIEERSNILDEESVVKQVFSSQLEVEKHVEEALKTLKSIST